MRKKPVRIAVAAAVLTLLPMLGLADVIGVTADHADGTLVKAGDGTLSTFQVAPGEWASRVGEYYAPGATNYEIPFQLPTLPAGAVITGATVQLQLYEIIGAPPFNLDLYAMPPRAAADILATDFYKGTLDPSTTLIQDNFITPNTPLRIDSNTGYVTPDTAAQTALGSYVASAYASMGAGSYVFLRLSPDIDPMPSGDNAYNILTRDAGATGEWPVLSISYSAVPEPATLGVLGAGAVLVLGRRRR